MNKIPLEATISAAYRFLFTRILSVLGTVWLPLLVMAVLAGGIIFAVVPPEWWHGQFPVAFGDKQPDLPQILALFRPFFIGMPPLILISLVLNAMMMVGLLRLSLGQTRSQYIFFSLGGDVWRVVLAMLLLIVILVLFYVVCAGVAVGASLLLKPFIPHGAWVVATVVLVIAAVCYPIYAIVRLYFFLPATIVAQHRIGFSHSWGLGRGNFWRIVLIFLVIVIPVGIVTGMVSNIAVMPIMASQLMQFQHHHHPSLADVFALFHAMVPLLPIMIGVGVVQRIAVTALMAGAAGSAYNALTPKQEENAAA